MCHHFGSFINWKSQCLVQTSHSIVSVFLFFFASTRIYVNKYLWIRNWRVKGHISRSHEHWFFRLFIQNRYALSLWVIKTKCTQRNSLIHEQHYCLWIEVCRILRRQSKFLTKFIRKMLFCAVLIGDNDCIQILLKTVLLPIRNVEIAKSTYSPCWKYILLRKEETYTLD